MPFWSKAKRPKDVKVLQVYKTGTQQNNLEFQLNEARAYYLERPDDNQRNWNYVLGKGNQSFYVVEEGPMFRIYRDQQEANIQFYDKSNNLAFTMEWVGKGDAGGLTAAPREHTFSYKGTQYEWSDSNHATGTDLLCKDKQSNQTVAYFKSVLTPANRAGKLELSKDLEEPLEDMLVASFVAYREWSIRRQMLIYGDDWFNQSVSN